MIKIFLFIALLSFNLTAQSKFFDLVTIFDNGVSFSPSDLSGLVNWYAQTYIETTGLPSYWVDETGNENAISGEEQTSPTVITNELNSYQVLRFDNDGGAEDFLAFDTFDYTQYSIFIVLKPTTKAARSTVISRAYNGSGLLVKIEPSTDGTNPNKLAFETTGGTTIFSDNPITGHWSIASILFGSGVNEKQIYVNGNLDSETNGHAPIYAADKPCIGAMLDGGGSTRAYLYLGDMAEILIYNVRVSASDRAKIETYLNTKYEIY